MAGDVGVDFFGGNDEEVLVAELARAFEVELLLHEALWAGIGDVGVVVKVAEIDDVDAESAKDGNPGGADVGGVVVANHLVELEMEVAGDGFESGDGLVDVVVRVGHHGLLRGVVAGWAQVVVDGHVLHGAGRRVVERVVLDLFARHVDAAVPDLVGDCPRARSPRRARAA